MTAQPPEFSPTLPPLQPPTLVVTRRLPQAVLERARRDYRLQLHEPERAPERADLLRWAEGADALLVTPAERCDAALIEALPARMRALATFSIGTDHIDLAAAAARGLPVFNTPDVVTEATAEVALLLMLGAARRAVEGERMIRAEPGTADAWRGLTPTLLLGSSLAGKRLAILGMGRIGRATAARARAFGMTIHYSNRTRLLPELEQGAVFHADPDTMLPLADVLSLHAPATPETRGWLDARRIALLPAQAIVVNTARGSLIDDQALIDALASGRLQAAGLDVFNDEPNLHPGYRPLLNTFLLPHLGTATVETRNAMGFRALDNLDAFFAGRPAPDRVV